MLKLIERLDNLVDYSNEESRPTIIYIYKCPQEKFQRLKNVELYETWDHTALQPERLRQRQNLMIFLDDVVHDAPPSFLKQIHTIDCHHRSW